ncbi:MAG: hypothetical protein ACO3O0_04035 [Bacteroidia bacterium]
MKNFKILTLASLAVAIGFSSCSKDEDNAVVITADNNANVRQTAFGSGQGQVADKIAVEAYQTGQVNQRYSGGGLQAPVVTHDTVNKIIYIDFMDGIIGLDSVNREGMIRVNYMNDHFAVGSVMRITFLNYKVDGKSLEGVRSLTNAGLNGDGNMYWNVEETNMKLTAPDGVTWRKWNSTRVREMTAGLSTPEESNDDIFKINGTATGGFSNGSTFNANIIDLVRESSCLWVSSGNIEAVVDNSNNFSFDYGSGTCDNLVTLTYPDGTSEVLKL